jgi:hypothetical protein
MHTRTGRGNPFQCGRILAGGSGAVKVENPILHCSYAGTT